MHKRIGKIGGDAPDLTCNTDVKDLKHLDIFAPSISQHLLSIPTLLTGFRDVPGQTLS